MLQNRMYTPAIALQSFPIWRERVIDMPWSSLTDSIKGTATVRFTNLVSAKAIITVATSFAPCWGKLTLNGLPIADFTFGLALPYIQTQEVDVTDKIALGSNIFVYTASKWLAYYGTHTVTLSLIIDAETISVEPPPWWEEWPSWWPYAVAGLGMAAVGGVILVRGKKK